MVGTIGGTGAAGGADHVIPGADLRSFLSSSSGMWLVFSHSTKGVAGGGALKVCSVTRGQGGGGGGADGGGVDGGGELGGCDGIGDGGGAGGGGENGGGDSGASFSFLQYLQWSAMHRSTITSPASANLASHEAKASAKRTPRRRHSWVGDAPGSLGTACCASHASPKRSACPCGRAPLKSNGPPTLCV